MLHSPSKKIVLPLCLSAIAVLFTPIAFAGNDTGDIASRQAAEQRAALAKKAAQREAQKAQAEAAKATATPEQKSTTDTTTPAPAPAPVEEQKEK